MRSALNEVFLVNSDQIIRAFLLAKATATTFLLRLVNIFPSQLSDISLLLTYRITARAP